MQKYWFSFLSCLLFILPALFAQKNIVTYAGNSGKDCFYDVLQITDGSFLVTGYAENLDWIDAAVPRIELGNSAEIHNAQGTNRFGFILHLSADFQKIQQVVYFPKGRVEDVRFIKTNTLPYAATGDLYLSGTTNDSRANEGGYFLAKLNHNFVDGVPDALVWTKNNWAESGPRNYQPWDVAPNGDVFFIYGQNHAYDWSAMHCLDGATGKRKVVNNWRTHWLKAGGEWRGTPATDYPNGGADQIDYSGIVFKSWGRCELRSWTQEDYTVNAPDGNGGTKTGKWPLDVLYSGPCDPDNPTNISPGYTGYSAASCCPVYGGTSIAIDRRNGDLYIGMNMKSVAANGSPDFEPALIAMDASGVLKWWSRLYHEITPAGDTVNSIPDQYIDALAIDYQHDAVVAGARCHGNNVENYWEGNQVFANPAASGFQNRFTGNNGNIHLSWLGKLRLSDGTLTNSTYMGEYAEGTGSLGAPHPDPNLDGWPNPNAGWPNVNTTRLALNNMKVGSNGAVCVLAVGRRTITTKNAYQKMVKPGYGGLSAWNQFVRVYDPNFNKPLYSSLIVGQWDTLTQEGGGNTEMFGVYKTTRGLVCVGRQTADQTTGLPQGNNLPVINVTPWGSAEPAGESAILAYYEAENLYNPDDSVAVITSTINPTETDSYKLNIAPNPAKEQVVVSIETAAQEAGNSVWQLTLIDLTSRVLHQQKMIQSETIQLGQFPAGLYQLVLRNGEVEKRGKLLIINN